MKKRIFALFAAMVVLCAGTQAFAAGLYPEYDGANTNDVAPTQRVNIVWENINDEHTLDILVDIIHFAAFSEDSEVWLYPIAGDKPPIEVKPTEECVNTLMNDYAKSSIAFKEGNVLQTAVDELNADADFTDKRLIMFIYEVEDKVERYSDEVVKATVEGNQGIIFTKYNTYGSSEYISANTLNIKNGGMGLFLSTELEWCGYEECYASYDERTGMVTLDKGAADDNIYIEAEAAKAEYLYISGYMQSATGFSRDADKKKAKGVSLSYNHINIEKKTEPRNVAAALFSIDKSVADVATEGFVIPVKNADSVSVYYKPDMGKGVCTTETTYDKTQDDKIVNLSAPSSESDLDSGYYVSQNEKIAEALSGGAAAKETRGTFGSVMANIGSVVGRIFSAIISLLWFALLAFVAALVANKKLRGNVHSKILASKFGPKFEMLTEKVLALVKSTMSLATNTVTRAKGNASLDEKFVFISHSSKDWQMPNNRIEKVVAALEARGVKCWMSETGIKPGENYATVLTNALKKCAMMIVFLSPSSAASIDVGNEMSMATQYRKTVIPVQIKEFDLFNDFEEWNYHLRQKQKMDLFSNDEKEVAKLADYIAEIYNGL